MSWEEPSDPAAIISAKDVGYTLPGGRPLLQEVSFVLRPGDRLALLGRNGAGKTTLLHLLAGLLQPQRGTIQVAGLNLAEADARRKLPTILGYVFQDCEEQLFHGRVEDDVAFGPLNLGCSRAVAKARVDQVLEQLQIAHLAKENPLNLSGGERQRVALAGVLAMEPQIILLDEPTAFLDAPGRRELLTCLNQLPQTLVVSTHDLDFVSRLCQRGILLHEGGFLADSVLESLLKEHSLLEKAGVR